jgi:N-acetylglucosamine PTS system EIICBA or EIICB component
LAYIRALGGAANIVSLDACTTRLRLVVADQAAVDAEALKRLGTRGMIRPSANALQVVVGTEADQVAGEMKVALRAAGSGASATAGADATSAADVGTTASTVHGASATPPVPASTLASLLAALGGRSNVRAVESASSRLRINIVDTSIIDQPAIAALGLRGLALAAPNWVHVIVGPSASATGASLRQLLA